MIGKTVSHYEILEHIGAGGMGEVYLAQDTDLERKVALKFLPESLQQDEIAPQRFLREAKSAAAIDHPFICKIYDLFIFRQFFFFFHIPPDCQGNVLGLKRSLFMNLKKIIIGHNNLSRNSVILA